MEVTNAVSPTQAQLEGFLDPAAKGPIYMLNLLNFKEQAEYEDCLLYTSPSPRDLSTSRMPSSA